MFQSLTHENESILKRSSTSYHNHTVAFAQAGSVGPGVECPDGVTTNRTLVFIFNERRNSYYSGKLFHVTNLCGQSIYTETIKLCPLDVYVCQFQMYERISFKFSHYQP